VAPDARIVYVDNDPLVLVHARALLTSSPQGTCDYIDADLREPAAILAIAAERLDFSQPVALMLMGIMGHIPDAEAYPIVSRLVEGLPSGSYLALYDGANVNAEFNDAQSAYNDSGAVPYHLRSPEQICGFSAGWDCWSPAWCRPRSGGLIRARLTPRMPPTHTGASRVSRRPMNGNKTQSAEHMPGQVIAKDETIPGKRRRPFRYWERGWP
jgi:hypothetical protein